MSWVAAAVAVGSAGYKIYQGEHAKSQAKKQSARLAASRPQLQITPEQQEQLRLSESEVANGGMSPETMRAYNNASDRQFSTSLDNLLKAGGSANNVGAMYDNSETGRQMLAITSQNMRNQAINRLFAAQNGMTDARNGQFKFNQWGPWADQAQDNAQRKVAAQQEIDAGIASAGQGIIGAFGNSGPSLPSFTASGSNTSGTIGGNTLSYNSVNPSFEMPVGSYSYRGATGNLVPATVGGGYVRNPSYATNIQPPTSGSLRIGGF